MTPPRTTNPDFQIGPRRFSTNSEPRFANIVSDWWKWVVAVVLGLAVISVAVVGYFVWTGRMETESAGLLRKAVSQLESSSTGGSDPAQQQDAIRLIREVVTRYPKSAAAAEATLRLGAHSYSLGNYSEARTAYTTYLSQNPNGIAAFLAGLGVGDTYLADRSYDKAAETYSRLVEQFTQEPLLPEAQLSLANAYLGLNRVKEAGALYEKIAATHPNTGWAQRAQSELYKLGLISR